MSYTKAKAILRKLRMLFYLNLNGYPGIPIIQARICELNTHRLWLRTCSLMYKGKKNYIIPILKSRRVYLPYDIHKKKQQVIMTMLLQHDASLFESFCSPKILYLAAVQTKSRKSAKHGLSDKSTEQPMCLSLA